MKLKYILFLVIGGAISACSTSKEQIYWVNSTKVDCDAGAGKAQCLQVSKNEDLDKAQWEYFYAPIENFVFEEGFFKKIQVKETQLDSKNVPADASLVKYTMIKEIEKQKDMSFELSGNWALEKLNGNQVTQSLKPNLELHLQEKKINGVGGCNNYFGTITELHQNKIQFGKIGATRKMCMDDNIEMAYFDALSQVRTFKIDEGKLIFSDASNKEILIFSPKKKVNERLHDIWGAVRIGGKSIEKKEGIPILEINLTEMSISGSDSCNNYFGQIEQLTDEKIVFAGIGVTAKLCPEMEIANQYNQAMEKVTSYKLEELNLTLYDAQGNEVLAFIKGD
ncbi:META domain-containing protein [Capnocytophaga canimorsus]|uniref:META domain-containing protein n=1 Tax=Capnocytophaga canimorsus TaxID=28188 RepID=UPI000F4DA217|nr:META domain-containing protein [Capnocytophaga canimorsus]AYW36200.1 META domain-containing protein [Capnocytophaga canimorsus]